MARVHFLLACVIFLGLSSGETAWQTAASNVYVFRTQQMSDIYGLLINGTDLDATGMRRLLLALSIGDKYAASSTGRLENCLTSNQLFTKTGLQENATVNGTTFRNLCPALVEQIVSGSCSGKKPSSAPKSTAKINSGKTWGYAILSVTIISLASMLGAFVVPFMNREFYQKVLLFMVSLAVGVLGGSGIFHLIPGTFDFDPLVDDAYLWKCAMLVGGIYFFFITESLMKIYIRFSDWKSEKDKSRINSETGLQSVELESHSVVPVVSNCMHEHGLDSLHIAGNHQLDSKDTSEVFVPDLKTRLKRIAPVAWMIIIGDGLHNFIDGLAIGVAFTSSPFEGVSTSLAIFSEELPHELGDFAILLNSGMSYKQAIFFNFISACTCFIGMAIGIALGQTTSAVKWIYALAAGMFLYISLVDMLPEATGMQVQICGKSKRETWLTFGLVNFGILFGFGLMLILAIYGPLIQV